MTYKVHRLDIRLDTDLTRIESFLNSLKGEVIAVFPNVTPTFMGMGGTARIDFVVVIEKLPGVVAQPCSEHHQSPASGL